MGRETQNAKKVDSTVPANVVKKALDIKKESRNGRASTNTLLCSMHQGEGGVNGTMLVARTELVLREEVVRVNVREDAQGDNLLQPFATALQKGDRPVRLGEAVIGAQRFRKWEDTGGAPRVVAQGKASIEEANKAVRRRREGPLQQLVSDATGARHGLVRGGG